MAAMQGKKNYSDVTMATMRQLFEKPSEIPYQSNEFTHFDLKNTGEPFIFSGTNSPFTLQHKIKKGIKINNQKFNSIDNFMWTMKFKELANTEMPSKVEREETGLKRCLSQCNVHKFTLEEWFLNRGLLYLQKAILKRSQSDKKFRKLLLSTGDRVLIYSYVNDKFLGSGIPLNEVRDWKNETLDTHYMIPKKFPLLATDLHHLPNIGGGRNVLGAIYMALREVLKTQRLSSIKVAISPLNPPSSQNEFGIPRKRKNSNSSIPVSSKRLRKLSIKRSPSTVKFIEGSSPAVKFIQNSTTKSIQGFSPTVKKQSKKLSMPTTTSWLTQNAGLQQRVHRESNSKSSFPTQSTLYNCESLTWTNYQPLLFHQGNKVDKLPEQSQQPMTTVCTYLNVHDAEIHPTAIAKVEFYLSCGQQVKTKYIFEHNELTKDDISQLYFDESSVERRF